MDFFWKFVENKNFDSDTKLMWDGGKFRVVVGIWWNWGRTKEEMKDMIADRNSDLGFTAYDSIHGD